MPSLSVALPLTRNSIDGFTMNKSFMSLARQNLKAICLTNPGERVMIPDFGAGIPQLLFENSVSDIAAEANSRIRKQVAEYLPMITISQISITNNPNPNSLTIQIRYAIASLRSSDLLQITI